MRDFLNYGDSLDIKFLIITILFILIWKIFIEKKIIINEKSSKIF